MRAALLAALLLVFSATALEGPMIDAKELSQTYMLALAVWREARGESYIGKIAVASVIVTRAWSPGWPDTIEGVILQPNQFSAFNSTNPNVLRYPTPGSSGDWAMWSECVRAAEAALTAPSHDANHYHALTVLPEWHDPSKVVATIGGHVFLKL